ncbi:hypothetical protein EDB81DRAFT_761604 [Dactylonectria macrodidyma]|uniref:Uncharacterized protein n=1 Tax=Dactylonectria macrodidyma TaxID=307937 RepID=A0A9P9EIV6_9HYPO|nr:hypothetical protein EDB81DRAFT_761604 [Dactylonectria macrodidyma]
MSSKYKNYCPAWALLFKKDDWLEAVMELQPEHLLGDPVPLLLGKDLLMKWGGKTRGTDLAILVNDWSGDCLTLQRLLFDCLHDHYINEILHGQQEISIQKPEKLIGFEREKGLFTYVSYYDKGIQQEIGPDCIAGIREREGKKEIEELCSVRPQFRGGETCYRELHRSSRRMKANRLVSIEEWGNSWTTCWS